MAPKPQPAAIVQSDVNEFLATEADFAFEMKTLHQLRSSGFECQHAGYYTDPNTDKRRQFDIRATRLEEQLELRLAVEAKNLRETSPLLAHMVRRTSEEAFHDIFVRDAVGRCARIKTYDSAYRPDEFVGKGRDQIARKADGTFQRSDADIYQKFGQAMNSARDLIDSAVGSLYSQRRAFAIVPVVVVPDRRLWQVKYDDDGSQLGEPEQVSYCSFFINQAWDVGIPIGGVRQTRYVMSHLEVVTLSGLKQRLDSQFYKQGGVFAGGSAVFNRTH